MWIPALLWRESSRSSLAIAHPGFCSAHRRGINSSSRTLFKTASSHPEKDRARKGWVQHLPAIPHHAARDGGVPKALQHFWSVHAPTHVSERYKKLLKQRHWRLQYAEKIGTGFTLPKPSSGFATWLTYSIPKSRLSFERPDT